MYVYISNVARYMNSYKESTKKKLLPQQALVLGTCQDQGKGQLLVNSWLKTGKVCKTLNIKNWPGPGSGEGQIQMMVRRLGKCQVNTR